MRLLRLCGAESKHDALRTERGRLCDGDRRGGRSTAGDRVGGAAGSAGRRVGGARFGRGRVCCVLGVHGISGRLGRLPGEATVTRRLADAAGSLLERRTSRRGFLARAALAGSAMVVAPLRYLLRPVSAWAVIGPGSCGSGLCTDGYTAFCCEINQGKNVCPPGTFIAGWWMCTR